MNEIEAAFVAVELSPRSEGPSVEAVGIFSVSCLRDIDALVAPVAVDDDFRPVGGGTASWTTGGLLAKLGIM